MPIMADEAPPDFNHLDLVMIPAMDAWAATVTSTTSKAGVAKLRYLAWKAAHAVTSHP